MSLLNDLIDRVAALTNRLNDIASNSKRTEEMPPMTPLERNSLIRVSKNGDSYKTSVQDIVGLFSDFDGIVQMGTLEIVPDGSGEALKIPDTPTPIWRINGQEYIKNTETIIPIPYANTGKYRTDIIVADENSDFQRIEGNEGDFIGLPPATPENTVEVTHINIFGDQIGDPSTPTLDGYITKASRNYKPISLESTTPQAIFLSQEISSFNIKIGSTSLATNVVGGFNTSGFSPLFNPPYDGQDIFIRTESAIELEHESNSVDIPFWFADSANLEIAPNIIVHLKYYKSSNRVEFLGMATGGKGQLIKVEDDIASMLADQANQIEQQLIEVEDASADINLTFPQDETRRQAFYKYNGIATGSLDDYTLISAPYREVDGGQVLEESTSVKIVGDEIQRAALIGDVTAEQNSNELTISDGAVSNAKMENMAANTIKGRIASTGAPQDLNAEQVRTILNVENGAQKNVKTDWNATDGDAELLNKPLQTNFNIFNQNKTNKVTISNTTKSSILAATTGTKSIPSYGLNDSFIGRVFGKYNNDNTATTATFSFVIGNRNVDSPVLNIEANPDDMAFSIDYVVNFSVAREANVSGVIRIGNQQFLIDLDFLTISGFNFDIMVTLSGGILTTNSSYFHRNYNG